MAADAWLSTVMCPSFGYNLSCAEGMRPANH